MNKLKLLFGVLLIGGAMNAQQFVVTPDGLRDSAAPENTFVVITAEGKTAVELYKSTIAYINEKYTNPDKVIKGNNENEYVRFDTFVSEMFFVKNGGVKLPINVTYTTEVRFKDNKIRYEIVHLDMGQTLFSGSIWKGYPIFNAKKENELRMPEVKETLETYFTSRTKELSDYVNGKTKKNDW